MKQYLDVAQEVIDDGIQQNNRTGVDTLSVFGRGVRYDLQDGFPIPTTKKGFFKGAKVELAWMLRGLTNVQYLNDNGVKFWDQWAIKGPHKVLKPLAEIKSKALLSPVEVDIDMLYMQGDIEGLESAFDFPVVDDVDDRYAMLPPTYEYVLQAVVETHMLTRRDAEKAMFEVACRLNPEMRPVDINEEIIAKANAEEMKLPEIVRQKTCEIGDLGPVYGQMIREFPNPDGTTTDQLAVVVEQIKNNPTSRRHLVDLWCPYYLPDEAYSPQENVARGKQALAPCHMLWTFKTLKATEAQKRKYVIENYKAFRLANLAVLVGIEQASKGGHATKEEEIEELVKVAPEYRLNLHSHLR